jgi:hypothetical protein
MSENIERDFRNYSHLSELPEHEAEVIKNFFNYLETLGFFTRSYDPRSLELYEAARILHKHLCTLDKAYYTGAADVKITEFANAFAKQNRLREL